jgi:uncharacterized RDD family membrane protein YckC
VSIDYGYMSAYRDTNIPDPYMRPELFEGVLWRRVFAYLIDVFCIGLLLLLCWAAALILTILSLGLLWPILYLCLPLVPLMYHTILLSGPRAATLGMRCLDVQLRSWHGERPNFLQALVQTALFYLTVGVTSSLVLILALFNRRKRTLHDVLAGTVVIRSPRFATASNPW